MRCSSLILLDHICGSTPGNYPEIRPQVNMVFVSYHATLPVVAVKLYPDIALLKNANHFIRVYNNLECYWLN